jgi:hypothetical protein
MGITRLALCFAFAGSVVIACAGGSNEKTGGGSSGSGGSGGSGNCGASVVCTMTLSYTTCTPKSGPCYIKLSTGAQLACTVADPCAATPDGGGGTSGTGGAMGSGGTGGTGGGEGGVPEAGSTCSSDIDAETCIICCEGVDMEGAKTFFTAFGDCACTSPGTCASECGSSYCAGTTATMACDTCLTSALSGACNAPVAKACGADPDCIAFNNCANSCPM